MKPSVGDRLELEVIKLVHGGLGLCRHEGFVVFVSGVIPGERVIAEITDVKKSHAFAHAWEILTPSALRVPHVWKEADISRSPDRRAGGADYGHIAIDQQRKFKTEILRDALVRFGRVGEEIANRVVVSAVSGDSTGLHWRTRVTLHVDAEGRAGPYAEGTRTVIPVEGLPHATEAINELGAHRANWQGHHTIRLVDPSDSPARMVIDSQKPQPINETVGPHTFTLSDQGFWQVHRGAALTLFDAVRRACDGLVAPDGQQHWDLYGGVGLFARAMLDALGENATVISVESDSEATGFATTNLQDPPKATAITSDVASFLAGSRQHHDSTPKPLGVVVLDPPRAGAKAQVVADLVAAAPERIVYVACDPVALARDLGSFAEHGYGVRQIDGFDLFPHTHHMEAVAIIEKV